MRFSVAALIAFTLVIAPLPALAQQKGGRLPERSEQFETAPPPAGHSVKHAADQPVDRLGFSAIYSADILQKSLAVVGKPLLVSAAPAAQPAPTTLAALTFKPSAEVERATRHKLLASLLETTKTPQVQDEIRQTIKSDDLWHQFEAVLKNAGLSSRNLADVTAAYYIIAWEVLNANDASADTESIRAVRDAVATGMAADGRLATMPDAEKQEAASVMAYMATVAADSVNELHRTGNEDALVRLREQVHDSIMAQGIDLDHLRLTDKGFAAR